MTKKRIEITTGFVQADYNFWVGKYMDKFYDGLEAKQILGNKCPTCNKVFVPPRKVCGICFKIIDLNENWIELKDTGTLLNFTATTIAVSESGKKNTSEITLIGMVQFDGSDTTIVYPILDLEEKDLSIGMRVQVVWNEELKGHPRDIQGFRRLEGGKS
jgi:uncharacterized OB-fold protein